jgi:hypothetical protein
MGPETSRVVCERSSTWPHTELKSLSRKQINRILEELPERII